MKKSVKFKDEDEEIEAPAESKRSKSSSSSGSGSSSSSDQSEQIDKLNFTINQLNLKIKSLSNVRTQQDKILKDQKTELS